jgi:hypothetical protein
MAYFPFRNIGLKFLSICIATLLWLVIAGDRIVERGMRVPVEYQNLPAGLEMVGDPVDFVDVRLRGSSGTIGRLTPTDTSAVIDLRSARPGRRLFHLTASQVTIPYGVEVVQVAPATLPIEFENSAVRIVQVRPSIEGQPATGYEVLNVTTIPATVEVIGPESSLRGLDEAMTEPVTRGCHRRRCRSKGAAPHAANGDGDRSNRSGDGYAHAQWRSGHSDQRGRRRQRAAVARRRLDRSQRHA